MRVCMKVSKKRSTNGHDFSIHSSIQNINNKDIGVATVMDEPEVMFEFPAKNPRNKANPISIIFLRYILKVANSIYAYIYSTYENTI